MICASRARSSYKDDEDLAYLDVDDYNSSYKPKKLSKWQMAAQQEKQQGIGGPMPTTVGENMAEGNLGAVGLGESPEWERELWWMMNER